MSTFVKDMYIKHSYSTNRQLLTGKMPTKRRLTDSVSGCRVNCHQDIQWDPAAR
jgi:hypothetical protein